MIATHLALGFITAYIGYMAPSMLTLTVSKVSLENNKNQARKFALAVSLVVLIQFFTAVILTSYLTNYPNLIESLQKISILVFAVLAIVFIYKGLKKTGQIKTKSSKKGFLQGLSLASVNMFAIPFYMAVYGSYMSKNWTLSTTECVVVFGVGTFVGVFSVLSTYILIAQKLQEKLLNYTQYVNLAIGILVGAIALFSGLKLYF